MSRRTVLAAGGAAALIALTGCGGGGGTTTTTGGVTVFKLSGRGRRISNAAKSHNANWLFVSAAVADANRAHPGDTSRVVPQIIGSQEYFQLFGGGKLKVDLRHV